MHAAIASLVEGVVDVVDVVDVGAHDGAWADETRRTFPGARVVCLEANPCHAAALAARGLTFRTCLLGAATGDTVGFYAAGGTGDSIFREIGPHYRRCEPVRMATCRLDDVPEVRALRSVDVLKIDVQGAELDVLRGAPETLAKTELVVAEASLLPYNEGAPLVADVVACMASAGFQVIGVVAIHAVAGLQAQVDLAFARRESRVFRTLAARVAQR